MAIHDKGKTQQPQQPNQTQQQQYAGYEQQQSQPHQPQQQQGPAGFGAVNQMFRRSGNYDRSEGRSAEALRALSDAGKDAIASQGLTDDYEMVRFDRDQHRVGLSSILVTKSVKIQGQVYMAVRTLILETEGIRLPPRVIQQGHQRVEVPTRPQDVFNDTYWNRIDEFLKRSKGVTDMRIVDAGPLVVPQDFDFTEADDVARLLITSVNRCDDIVAGVMGEQPFNVEHIKSPSERLTARIVFSDVDDEPAYNIVHHPVRNDIQISLNRQVNTQQPQEDFYEVETHFNSVSGFVNLEYVGPAQPQPGVQYGQQQQPQHLFMPAFIITSVDQADWIQAQTFELYLLAISNAYRATAGNAWVNTFYPKVGRSGVDPKDVGALGYKTVKQMKIETKSDSFSEQHFGELMFELVRPQPTFMIDVDPVGDHASIETYLLDAASDGPNRHLAIGKLVKAADNLTGGRFSQYFDANQTAPIIPSNIEVNLGYYVDADGTKRDIRDLDVLAMLNYTQGDMNEFERWYRTYVDFNVPNELRMQTREQMERQFLSKGLKITGRAIRLILSGPFVEALDRATRDAGLHVDFESTTSIIGGQRFVGNTMIGQYAVSGNASMGYGPAGNVGPSGPSYGGVSGGGRYY